MKIKTNLKVKSNFVSMTPKKRELVSRFRNLSLFGKFKFFCRQYGFFFFVTAVVGYILMGFVLIIVYQQHEALETITANFKETAKHCQELESIIQATHEKTEKDIKELEEQLKKAYAAVLVPKFRGFEDYEHPRLPETYGSIHIPSVLSLEKNPPKDPKYGVIDRIKPVQIDLDMYARLRTLYGDEIVDEYLRKRELRNKYKRVFIVDDVKFEEWPQERLKFNKMSRARLNAFRKQ